MSFVSLLFLPFLGVMLLLHWLLPHRFRYIALLLGSYFFYAFLNPWLIALILGTTLISYLSALGMRRFPKRAKLLLVFTLIAILGTLFVFKYLDFALSLFVFCGLNLSFYPLNIILPIGISFYSFQTIAYVVDVYKGKVEPEKHFLYFALFISFFPQLVAGPIEKYGHLMPQLKKERTMDINRFGEGLRYLTIGLVKKIVLADFLSLYVNGIYENLASSSGMEIILATFLFGLVIYGDFSGYSDIAVGCAKWFGIDLLENFSRPYLSSSLKEFWNRWHITLNDFFTEYIYIPLGGSRKGKLRKYLNIALVFLISGLWHGASLHFLLWGLAHGAMLIIEDLFSPITHPEKEHGVLGKMGRFLLTYILINILWIFFRCQSVSEISIAFSRIFTGFAGFSNSSFISLQNALWLIGAIALLIVHPCIPRISSDENALVPTISTYIILFAIIGIAYFANASMGGESSFIYFQF